MLCKKCGTKNSDNHEYCEKCLYPLKAPVGPDQASAASAASAASGAVSLSAIFITILAVIAAILIFVLPTFTFQGSGVVLNVTGMNPQLSVFGEDVTDASMSASRAISFVNIFCMVSPLLIILCMIITVACAFAKKYSIQNFFAVMSVVLNVFTLAAGAIMGNIFSADGVTGITFSANIGFYTTLVLAVIILYFTQSTKEGLNIAVIAGIACVVLGVIVWAIGSGYFTQDIVQRMMLRMTEDGRTAVIGEITGCVFVIAGGIISAFGFEYDDYKSVSGKSPKTIPSSQ